MDLAIRISQLVKRYGEVTAVNGLDLEVRTGECFGLLGPNGAGKTTTCEILEGLQPPTSGEVEVLGQRWGRDENALRARIGVALQETQLSDRLTVSETLTLFRSFYDRGRDALLKYMPAIIKPQGYCNEIYRDPWHGIVALTGTIQAAEVGRHQNDLSIYHARYEGQADPRLLIALRWYADPLRGKPVPVPPMGGPRGKTQPWAFIANHSSRNTGGFEMALNFYEWIEPAQDLDGFRDAVLRTYRPSGQDNSLFIESDTLTHANLNKPPVP